jgi:hypothetical protein
MNTPSIIVTDRSITVVFIGESPKVITADHANFAKCKEDIKNRDWDSLRSNIDVESAVKRYVSVSGEISIDNGVVMYKGEPVHNLIVDRILQFMTEEMPFEPLVKFLENLMQNPSYRARKELYAFLEHEALPITEDGHFLAYKAVRNNFTDKHTGKFLNTVDSVLEMPRNKVDDNKEVGCSYGFHAGTVEYALGFACGDDKLVLVEINPADVVSIPTDCNFQKLRTCKYKVVGEYERPLEEAIYPSRYETDNDDDVDIWGNEEEEDLCSGCNMEYNSWCCECEQCGDCCDCGDCAVDDEDLEDFQRA